MVMQAQVQVGGEGSAKSAADMKPPSAAASLLKLAVDALELQGGEAAGVDLLAGLLAAGGHATLFASCLAAVLAAGSAPAREAGLGVLAHQHFDALPLPVIAEAIIQVNFWTSDALLCCKMSLFEGTSQKGNHCKS